MWCERCRQNVTGMVSQTQDSVCCARCGCALAGSLASDSQATDLCRPVSPRPAAGFGETRLHSTGAAPLPCPAPTSPAAPRPPALDRWDIDEDLRHIERLLRRDPARLDVPALHLESLPHQAAQFSAPAPSWLTYLRTGLAWLLLCAGLASTVCGLMLLAWYWFANRAELLIPGLVGTAAGQFGLLGGFLIQPPADAPPTSSSTEAEHPAAQWLEVHRKIDEILRADLPGER
jgi:hypothetical protein